MNTATAMPVRLLSGSPAPELDVPLAQGGRWRLSEQRPEKFTLVVVFRGFHCSFCKPEIEKLQTKLLEFSAIGIAVLAVSMDSEDHAANALVEWAITDLPFAYGLTVRQARAWGLYISKRVKQQEPEIFSEPGAFLIRPSGTLYAEFQSTAPWLRLDFDLLLRGIQVAIKRGTPPRGAE